MKGFLEEVAADLYARYGEGLSERAVLFPSRRARLFFVDALGRIAGRPMWQPEWVTIDDLTGEISGLHTGDRVRLITELYKVYSAYHNEPFDKFYFWGDMLLTDFDTIDKYLIDAQMLFRNISEIKEIEADISYLTPAQLRILSFWSSFGEQADLSEEKRRFLAIWKTLGPIYRRFRERLSSLGIAYNGMVQRAAADRIRGGGFVFPEPRRYVVAGFNALSECEKRLFGFLATAAETDFYWDYDSYYKDDPEQEAGMFVRSNVAQFPPRTELRHDNMRGEKQIVSVAAVSNAVQCKYAAAILADLARRRREEDPGIAAGARPALGKETAVVLTDENLLLPLLYALPADIGRVNVTMGFPLRQSLAYTFVERLVELQNHRRRKGDGCTFYHADVAGILAHPYVAECDAALTRTMHEEIVRDRRISVDAAWLGRNELLKRIFTPAATWRELSDYMLDVVAAVARQPYEGDDARQRVEFLAVIAEQVTKLRNSLDECDIDLTAEVYTSLLRRHLQTLRIPFEGEPRDPQPRFRKRHHPFDERRQFPRQSYGAGVVHPLQPACGLRAAHARAPRGRLCLLFLPPDPARQDRPHALLLARRRQVDGRAEPLYLPVGLRERLRRAQGRSGGGRQPGRNGADRGAQGRRGDGPAGAFRRRPKPCDALADGVFPLRGLPLALLFPFHSPLGGR